MQAQGVGLAGAFECAHVRAPIVKVVLGVNFDPPDPRLLTQQRLMVRGAQPDPAPARIGPLRFDLPVESTAHIFAGGAALPPIFSHSPLGTYFHSAGALSIFA